MTRSKIVGFGSTAPKAFASAHVHVQVNAAALRKNVIVNDATVETLPGRWFFSPKTYVAKLTVTME